MNMISRPDFFRSVCSESENSPLNIGDLFDEIMALYNIVAGDYVSVKKRCQTTEHTAEFDVEFVTAERAAQIYYLIQNKEIVIYNHPLQIICWYEDGSKYIIISFHSLN